MAVTSGSQPIPPYAGRREWTALAILTAPVLLMSIDLTVLSVAVPNLSQDLEPTGNQLLWIIDVYGIFLAGLLILMGSIGDRIGRRRLLMIGAVAFGAASALAAFAWTAEVLIVARALLGVGGATLMPSTLSLIRNIFKDPRQRRTAVAIWTAGFAGGVGLGPVVGGTLLEHFAWGSVFLINLPVMVLLLIVGPLVLPESKDPSPAPFDFLSSALLIGAILLGVYGLKHAGDNEWAAESWLWISAGILLGVLVAVRLLRARAPMIDLRLFRSLPFSVSVLANMAGIFALTSLLYFFPQYVQIVLGKSPLESGLWALPIAGGAIIGALIAPTISKKVPIAWLIGIGFAIAAVGFVVMSTLGTSEAFNIALIGGFLLGFGIGLEDPLTNDVIIGSAPPQKVGAAAGIGETGYELGAALGTATLGTLGTAMYRSNLEDRIPDETPNEVTQAASETLGAAAQLADLLPPEFAGTYLETVHRSFTDAMTDTFTTAAIVIGITAVFASVTLLLARPKAQDGS